MSNLLKYIAYGLGAFVLFLGSFLAFAAFTGTPMHEMAVIGDLFPGPPVISEPESAETGPLERLENEAIPNNEVIKASSMPLQAFVLDAEFMKDDMEGLQRELKSSLRANELRTIELDNREEQLDLMSQHLEERWEELEKLRDGILQAELQMEQRKAELDRDSESLKQWEEQSWKNTAVMFAEGQAKKLAPTLMQYPPDKAARILRALPEARASELLGAMPPGTGLDYLEAYRLAEPRPGDNR